MVVREKNCYYAIALTDFFVFLSCAEEEISRSDAYTQLNKKAVEASQNLINGGAR